MKSVIILLAALLMGVDSAASADSFSQGGITVTDPWSRPTPPGVPVGVGYMAISNQGDTAITLLTVTTPKAGAVTIHQSRMNDGMMSMRRLTQGLVIAAGDTVRLEPGGYHLMLEGLRGAVVRGERFPMTLNFESGAAMRIQLQAMPMAPSSGVSEGPSAHGH